MIKSRLKQEDLKISKEYANVTSPIHIDSEAYETLQKINNKRIFFDRLMFFALGSFAVWAFYSALASLML